MKSILVVGHGPIGHSFIEKMTGDGCSYEISVLCEEPRPAYNRVMLTQYFEDRDGDKHLEVSAKQAQSGYCVDVSNLPF